MITVKKTLVPIEVVTLAQAKEHSRITDSGDDVMVQMALDAAHDMVENWLNRKLAPTDILGIETNFKPEMVLPYPPIASITSLFAEDKNGDSVELTLGTDFKFDDITGSIKFIVNHSDKLDFKVEYKCGYPSLASCPAAVKHAVRMTFATLYENREDAVVGTQVNEVPLTARNIIKFYRVRGSG